MLAVWNNQDFALNELLRLRKNEIDLNMRDNFNDTALHLAFKRNNFDMAYKLIEHGADINLKGNQKEIAFAMFPNLNDKERFFVDNVFSLSTLSAFCFALWFYMIQVNDIEAMPKVIYAYVNKYPELALAKDSLGRSALDVASQQNKLSINCIFLWHGRYRAEVYLICCTL